MRRRMRTMVCATVAFALLSAGECDIGDVGGLLNERGTISVTNTGTEAAVVAVLAAEVKSYPTLAAGASASVETNVGGQYEVRVVMTPENAQRYREDLFALRRSVEKLIDGSLTSQEKVELFTKLAGIKAAIQALEQSKVAGCNGRIELNQDEAETVTATVQWVPQGGAGFWDATCGSN
jgi:hypothetical protein